MIYMPKTKICAVQFKVSPSFDKNISRAEQFFKKANKNNCDIICFPEIFLAGQVNGRYISQIPIKSKKIFSNLSEEFGIFSVMGSIIEKIENKLFNVSYLFDSQGSIVGSYKKNHLTKGESKYLESSNDVKVFKTKIGNIGIQICRDLLYPELTRRLMLKGAEIIFCPSFWGAKSPSYDGIYNNKYFKNINPKEVDSLVSARAIESHAVFVYVNGAGNFTSKGKKEILLGRSQIAYPFYGTTSRLSHNKEGTIIKEVDLSIVKDAKKVYKIEKDLKDYYR